MAFMTVRFAAPVLALSLAMGFLPGRGVSGEAGAEGRSPSAESAGKSREEGAGKPSKPEPKMVKIGKVRWFREGRRIEVDGRFSCQDNLLEFLAVLKGGKEYESLLVFDCRAIDLNLALIGAGYKAEGGVRRKGDPNTPKGDPVYLRLRWKTDAGKAKTIRAEDLLYNRATKKPMRRTAWVFSGSSFVKVKNPETGKLEYRFLADEYRMLIAIWRDPAAMFNNPLDTGRDDVFYVVNEKAVPPPVKFLCPRHPEVTSKQPGKCHKCEVGTPLVPQGRPVTLVIEPAPKDALKPENLKDGAELAKNIGETPEPKVGGGPAPGGQEEEAGGGAAAPEDGKGGRAKSDPRRPDAGKGPAPGE
jgi:hypothetical protein